jgi:hypothetical protein
MNMSYMLILPITEMGRIHYLDAPVDRMGLQPAHTPTTQW